MTIFEIIEKQVGFRVTADTPIESLELDSLEFVQLLIDIENETGFKADDRKAASARTIGELEQLFIVQGDLA